MNSGIEKRIITIPSHVTPTSEKNSGQKISAMPNSTYSTPLQHRRPDRPVRGPLAIDEVDLHRPEDDRLDADQRHEEGGGQDRPHQWRDDDQQPHDDGERAAHHVPPVGRRFHPAEGQAPQPEHACHEQHDRAGEYQRRQRARRPDHAVDAEQQHQQRPQARAPRHPLLHSPRNRHPCLQGFPGASQGATKSKTQRGASESRPLETSSLLGAPARNPGARVANRIPHIRNLPRRDRTPLPRRVAPSVNS